MKVLEQRLQTPISMKFKTVRSETVVKVKRIFSVQGADAIQLRPIAAMLEFKALLPNLYNSGQAWYLVFQYKNFPILETVQRPNEVSFKAKLDPRVTTAVPVVENHSA